MWEQQCETCHKPWQTIRWDGSRLEAGGTDEKCITCHAGAKHHPDQKESGPACAACHRDHQGREANLARADDKLCVDCHRNLEGHRKDGAGPRQIAAEVGNFSGTRSSHPEFKAVTKRESGDPGKVSFNHARHLQAGMPVEGGGPVFIFAQLPEGERPRYGWRDGMKLDEPVRLDCKACHQLDNADVAGWLGLPAGSPAEIPTPRGAGGAMMLPVRFEAHCRACHPLTIDPQRPEWRAPHGVEPGEVLARIGEVYGADAARERPELLDRPVPRGPVPGVEKGEEIVSEAVADEVLATARMLFGSAGAGVKDRGGCLLCHEIEGGAISLSEPGGLAELAERKVEPAAIPTVWFTKARFDHTAHRAMECASCHQGVEESSLSAQVLLPGKESCLPCHDSRERSGTSAGGACTTCHGYHDMANPWHGRGSQAGGAGMERAVRDFLGR
jgi:predicted CXXCH cytochrome family protein